MCSDFIRSVLSGLFSRPNFERDLCFDLRNEEEDQSINQREFLKVISGYASLSLPYMTTAYRLFGNTPIAVGTSSNIILYTIIVDQVGSRSSLLVGYAEQNPR